MTVYYQDGAVRVTDLAIEVAGHTFPTRELAYVWHTQGRVTPRIALRRLTRLGLIVGLTAPAVGAVVLAVRVIGAAEHLAARIGLTVALVVLGLVLLMLLAPLLEFPLMALERSYDRGATVREIWIHWQGQNLLLLRTSDAARFGKIYRAIERAVEQTDH